MGCEKTISCSLKGCDNKMTVMGMNKGFEGWGGLNIPIADENGDQPAVCPDCIKEKLLPLLKKEDE